MDEDNKDEFFYHPLENIEEVDLFYEAVEREHLIKGISDERPYTYWTIELYDQKNGIRGGGGLGVLAADTRRIAEKMNIPFVLITPFYPFEAHQVFENGKLVDKHLAVDYHNYGFRRVDSVSIKCCGDTCELDVIEKRFKDTRIIAITEPNFGELYSGMSGSDHRLYQEVALGFGGYAALKLVGLKPAVIQLNEVATFFAALARLDELVKNGMDFYEAVVYTRKHTLYTNHTLVQAAEAEFGIDQFERFVFPNLKSPAVRRWIQEKFIDGKLKLSSVSLEIAELKNGVSKLHARVANYRDIAGNRVKFKAVTNGIDMDTWIQPEIMNYFREVGIFDQQNILNPEYDSKLDFIGSEQIRLFKQLGRKHLNAVLMGRPDQNGKTLCFDDNELVFDFKRRFVDYKRPELAFSDPVRLRKILETYNAHYILTGRVHTGDNTMMKKLTHILDLVKQDDFLNNHVHYLADYDEQLAYALSVGSNVAINNPIVGVEACGTSWMKDVGNLNILISTHDGGVADGSINSYLNIAGDNQDEEVAMLYQRMNESALMWKNDFELEFQIRQQLSTFLPVISGTRMLREYIDYLFPV